MVTMLCFFVLLLGIGSLKSQYDDTSLGKLLTDADGKLYHEPDETYRQHLQEIENNLSGANVGLDESSIKLPIAGYNSDFKKLPTQNDLKLSDESLEHSVEHSHMAPYLSPELTETNVNSESESNKLITPSFSVNSTEDSNAQKREEERYEASVLNNPRPKTDKEFEAFVHNNAHMEMEEGDAGKEPPKGGKFSEYMEPNKNTESIKESLQNYFQNRDVEQNNGEDHGQANKNKNESEPATAHVDSIEPKHDNETNLKTESRAISEFSNMVDRVDPELLGVNHHVESDLTDELALNEEDNLNKRLSFLKKKLKQRQRLNIMKEQNLIRLEDQRLFPKIDEENSKMEEKPKLEMHRIDNTNLNVDISGTTGNTFNNQPTLVLRNITDAARARGSNTGMNKALFAFSYDPESPFGPPQWQLLNPEWTCTARKQSPINIETNYVLTNQIMKNIMIKVVPPNSPLSGVLRNNGHAPTLSLADDISVKLFGGSLTNDYYLKQLHFHFGCDSSSGSEHHIDGVVLPLELHLVFWDNSTFATFPEAAKADRGIAVVAVLFQALSVPFTELTNSPLSQVVQLLRHIDEEGDNVTVSPEFNLKLEKLLPNVMNPEQVDRFFIYEGSLTTPGCYESVTWIVFATHPPVTESQLRVFRSLKSSKVSYREKMCNNYRPVQKKQGRRIYSNMV